MPAQSNGSSIAQPSAIFNTGSCSAASSIAVVVKACLGQRTCTLSATNSVFGDPCPSVYKQLSIQFACGAGPATYSVAATAPENTFAQVTCPVGYHIDSIDSASFGNPTAACSASSSIAIAKAECLGKNSCFLAKENFGQDPCLAINKSLSIRATCRPNLDPNDNPVSVVIQNTIPQDGFARIQCPGVFTIANVLFASYGNPFQGDVVLSKAEFTLGVTTELQNRWSQLNGNFQIIQRQYQRYVAQRQRNSVCLTKVMIDPLRPMYKSSVIAAAQDVQRCIDGSFVRQ
ncbi:hypothetical protein THRCLA_21148 [Thraustotheca clavata]|uniref:SUEL-type lectin domain-containing protein n=1 Tax=Thraustotheca clavata TaxID=74557 RepID=A0A1W0A0E2_9STRA|nr:hypothetical protein THRCLA_21148 [Thraustotheca clavata]